MPARTNRFGRRGGRGFRPWLLLPKILGVAVYFGAVAAGLAITVAAEPSDAAAWRHLGGVLRVVFVGVAIPGLLVALACGAGLLWMHGKPLWERRWLRLKLAMLAISIPPFHLWIGHLVRQLRTLDPAGEIAPAVVRGQLVAGLVAVLVVAAAVIVVGRHKPRLGQ